MGTNVNISGTQAGFCSESAISISSDPNKIIAASNTPLNQGQYWSVDGGVTWQHTILKLGPDDVNHSDPAVNWTSDGTAWAAVIGIGLSTLAIRVYKSGDGGATWTFESTGSGSHTNTDRETLWVDRNPSSPFLDNMYLLWHNNDPCFVAARKGPGGTWGAPVKVSGAETTSASTGGNITTNANGDVFALWPDTGSRTIFVAKSTDGGAVFSAPVKVASTFGSFQIEIPAQALRKASLYVSVGAFSAGAVNMVYACWADLSGDAGCSTPNDAPDIDVMSPCKMRVWFSRSSDGGTTWDPPKKINDQNGLNDQFYPRLAVDDATGAMVVVYYDTVGDPGRHKTDLWMQSSTDNGATWSGAMPVTTGESDETMGANVHQHDQYGDYIGLSSAGGKFFACWTDRRNDTFEQIWGAPIAIPRCELIVDKSTFGQDEVAANLSYPSAFWLAVDGFTNEALGFTSPAALNAPPNPAPAITVTIDAALNPGLQVGQIAAIAVNLPTVDTFGPSPVLAVDPMLAQELQRFSYPYTISFANNSVFEALNAHQSAILTLHATLTVGLVTVQAGATIELAKGEDPYFQDIDTKHPADFPFWLSYDLRFFKVTPNQPHHMFSVPSPANAGGAVKYIQDVIHNLNNPNLIVNGDTFETTLKQGEGQSALEFLPKDSANHLTFDFAVARVRILGNSAQTIFPVRVFFRLFQAASTVSNFDENTTYRWGTDGSANHKIPLLGVQNDQHGKPEYVTIPCFATKRVNLDAPADMKTQHDDPNARHITTIPGVEVDTYFGCWIDVNQPSQKFLIPTPPAAQSKWDGPWTGTESVNGAITAAPHQCLIAEIRFDDTPVPAGATSSTSDKIAQRNIAWIDGPNPGTNPSRVMPHPFEIRASSSPATAEPDELMITWGKTPAGSTASLYLPEVKSSDVVALANKLYSTHHLTARDAHTVACHAAGVTFIPVPNGAGRYAGLLSVELPAGIKRGEAYDIVVRQITNAARVTREPLHRIAWRRILGAFQVAIAISTKQHVLVPEERLLSWLKWRISVTPHAHRWYPVLLRYAELVAGRVRGFGGDPAKIRPSPSGDGRPGRAG